MQKYIIFLHKNTFLNVTTLVNIQNIKNLLRCAIEELFQLFFTAPFMAGIKDVDLGVCSRGCTHLGQLTTNTIIPFFQVLNSSFLSKTKRGFLLKDKVH